MMKITEKKENGVVLGKDLSQLARPKKMLSSKLKNLKLVAGVATSSARSGVEKKETMINSLLADFPPDITNCLIAIRQITPLFAGKKALIECRAVRSNQVEDIQDTPTATTLKPKVVFDIFSEKKIQESLELIDIKENNLLARGGSVAQLSATGNSQLIIQPLSTVVSDQESQRFTKDDSQFVEYQQDGDVYNFFLAVIRQSVINIKPLDNNLGWWSRNLPQIIEQANALGLKITV